MMHRVRTAVTALAAVVMLLCPLTAGAQETGGEETAPTLSPFLTGPGGYAPLLTLFNPTVGHARLRLTDRVNLVPRGAGGWPIHPSERGPARLLIRIAALPAMGQPFPDELWRECLPPGAPGHAQRLALLVGLRPYQ